MKKFLLTLLGLLIIAVGSIWWMLFTKNGNEVLKPRIETYLNQKLPVAVHLERFQISPVDIKLAIGKSSLDLHGAFHPFSQSFDIAYDVVIEDLSTLKALHGQHIRGPLNAKGTIKGNIDKFSVAGTTDLAKSKSNYTIVVADLHPKSAELLIKEASLKELQYMFYQPIRTFGLLNVQAKMKDLDPKNLTGNVVAHITKGRINDKQIAKEFGIKGAKINYILDANTALKQSVATTDAMLKSSIANLNVQKSTYDIKKNILTVPYHLAIPDLSRLYFLTSQRMQGHVEVDGRIEKAKELKVTAHSKILHGTLEALLAGNTLDAKAKGIDVVALTDMLYYPKIFDSKMDANLSYNIAAQKGTLDALATDGRILPNKMTFLLQQMAKFDITKEIYKTTKLHSGIDGKKIISNLDMQSRLTHITAEKALVDLQKELVDAKLRIEIKNRPVYVKLTGNLKSPKVKVDAKELLKSEVKRQLQKKLEKKAPKELQNILKLF